MIRPKVFVMVCSLVMSWEVANAFTFDNSGDTFTVNERWQLKQASRKSSFGYFQLADSCSRKGDIAGAGSALLRIDPYFFMFLGIAPDSIGQYLNKRFKLAKETRESYVSRYTEAYTAERTSIYTILKTMYEEDKNCRRLLNTCGDSFSCETAKKQFLKSDSARSSFLCNYVQRNGWPSLADGSLYAGRLAINDHLHHKDYMPLLKAAVLAGNIQLDILDLVYLWDKEYDDEYIRLQKTLATHVYERFDISSVVKNRLPLSLARIERAVKRSCPPQLYFVAECRDQNQFDIFWKKETKEWMNGMGGIFSELVKDLSLVTCKTARNYAAMKTGLMSIKYYPSESNELRVILYVVKHDN